MPYSVSTHNNPFSQGGWQSRTSLEESSAFWDNATNAPSVRSNLSVCTSISVTESSPIVTPISPLVTPVAPSSTIFRLIPSSGSSTTNDEHTSCSLLSPNNRILYTVSSTGPSLVLIKDSHGRPAALVESSATPSVDFRGSTGKKRVDEWLMQDSANPYLRFMLWNDEWYYWTISDSSTHLYQWSDYIFEFLAEVRPWGSMFEIEMTSPAMKKGLLEPSLVALVIMRSEASPASSP